MKYLVKVFENEQLVFQLVSDNISDVFAVADKFTGKVVKCSLLDEDK